MVINFEEFTEPLTDREKELIPYFYDFFINNTIGKENIKRSDKIIKIMTKILMANNISFKGITPVLIGKIVHILRYEIIIPNLIGTSRGYYVAIDDQEILDGIESMRQRATSINAAAAGMERGYREGRCIKKKGGTADRQAKIIFPDKR